MSKDTESQRMAWNSLIYAKEALKNAKRSVIHARQQMTKAKRFARHIGLPKEVIQKALSEEFGELL